VVPPVEEPAVNEAETTEGPDPEVKLVAPAEDQSASDLLSLNEAIDRVPESLRKAMQDRLRAEFREVRRWEPTKGR
jgi:hypothetical protein